MHGVTRALKKVTDRYCMLARRVYIDGVVGRLALHRPERTLPMPRHESEITFADILALHDHSDSSVEPEGDVAPLPPLYERLALDAIFEGLDD